MACPIFVITGTGSVSLYYFSNFIIFLTCFPIPSPVAGYFANIVMTAKRLILFF